MPCKFPNSNNSKSEIFKLTPDLIKELIKEENEKIKIDESKKIYIIYKLLNEIKNEQNKLKKIKKNLIKKLSK